MLKILAIEDQPIAAAALVGTLKSLGQEVCLASSGEAAWALLQKESFRVIVSDWQMPGLNGLELCRRVRASETEYIYFILISSARVTKASREEAIAAGVDDYLTKPLDPEQLGMRLHVAERIIHFSAQVKTLESFLPICGYCKKIRDDDQYWKGVEQYFGERQGTRFSHGICPSCYAVEVVPQLKKLGIDPAKIRPA
jgi:CheY-like chemotaxis protein